mmetsp:Transcript_7444/g.6675  ORF Transcript_7444/g.6675 Transcript_7444/m.6675 type:complete len:157 (+) Transcript_7444:131-601(+)
MNQINLIKSLDSPGKDSNEVKNDGIDNIIVLSNNSNNKISISKIIKIKQAENDIQIIASKDDDNTESKLIQDLDDFVSDSTRSSGSEVDMYEDIKGFINANIDVEFNEISPCVSTYNLAELESKAPSQHTNDIHMEVDFIKYPKPQLLQKLTKKLT